MCNARTLITGVSPNTNIGGLVLDPLNASGLFTKDKNRDKAPAPPEPAVERASAEAEAQQRANLQLAEDKRRRREQQSLIAKGAPQPTLGDSVDGAGGASPLGTSTSARPSAATNTRTSLISLGAAPAATGARPPYSGGGGGGGRYPTTAAF